MSKVNVKGVVRIRENNRKRVQPVLFFSLICFTLFIYFNWRYFPQITKSMTNSNVYNDIKIFQSNYAMQVEQLRQKVYHNMKNNAGTVENAATFRAAIIKEIEILRVLHRENSKPIYIQKLIDYIQYYTNHNVTISPKRSGIKAISAIINEQHSIIMCTVPKCGSSSWRKFMLYLQFPYLSTKRGKEYYKSIHKDVFKSYRTDPDPHAIAKNGVNLIAHLNASDAVTYYNNPKYLKVK